MEALRGTPAPGIDSRGKKADYARWKGTEIVHRMKAAAWLRTLPKNVPPLFLHGFVIFFAALLLSWPAILNRFPLLYPDSMTYLSDGGPVARALFLHQFAPDYGLRSLIYSLGILPFHWNTSPWPVVGLQCLLVAWVLWLVTRSILPRHSIQLYLSLIFGLSLLSSVSWYSGFVMPDILGPVLYLSVYLLVFAPETLSRFESLSLYPIVWWSITAHSTHLMLAAGLCALLGIFACLEGIVSGRPAFLRRLVSVGQVCVLLFAAALSQMLLYAYLDGEASLNGERPPYLTARIIADGPGKHYLDQHCSQLDWEVCKHLQNLSADPDNFLWGADGVFENSSESGKVRLRREEMPFVLATVQAYPREQFAISAANFRAQLFAFGLYGFDSNPWITNELTNHLQASGRDYLHSLQAADRLPLELFSSVQWWVVVGSMALIGVLAPLVWRRREMRLTGLGLIVTSMIVANAFLAGVLSVVDDRYGCRVIWMVPLLAALMSLEAWETARSIRANRLVSA